MSRSPAIDPRLFFEELAAIGMLTTKVLSAIAYTSRSMFDVPRGARSETQALADYFWLTHSTSFLNRLIDAIQSGDVATILSYCDSLTDLFRSKTLESFPQVPGGLSQAADRLFVGQEIRQAIYIIESVRSKVRAAGLA